MAIPAGFLGLHHFYLERPYHGIMFLLTGGLFGVGWFYDLMTMPLLVAKANKRLADEVGLVYEVQHQIGGECVVIDKSNLIAIPAYNQNAAPSCQQQTSVIVDPWRLCYNGPFACVSPPPYTEAPTTVDNHVPEPSSAMQPESACSQCNNGPTVEVVEM
jgi:TM2 domain-containing membrane protein YozV